MATMRTLHSVFVAALLVASVACSTTNGGGEAPATHTPSPAPTMISKAFDTDLTAAGIPQDAHLTLESWAMSACQLLPKMGMSDKEVIANLPGDVAPNGVTLTPEQATKVWASAKVNVCGLPKTTLLPPS
ncbi:hypothetical protein [Mycobacterium sp. AZCC_0083]|uniref:hypothetical protein n=1 Tax=Mycobacterium sp. AZCC_0083 TaxID=2735882 RepID=UPI001C85FBEF|nr:hypothetical protein [Mycobacterium sp. AZCC_0083]